MHILTVGIFSFAKLEPMTILVLHVMQFPVYFRIPMRIKISQVQMCQRIVCILFSFVLPLIFAAEVGQSLRQ